MKKLLKALGITIALITVGAVTRARVKSRPKLQIKPNGTTVRNKKIILHQ